MVVGFHAIDRTKCLDAFGWGWKDVPWRQELSQLLISWYLSDINFVESNCDVYYFST